MPKPVNYNSIATSYDTRWARERYEGVEEAIVEFVGGPEAGSVFEVGCGTGHWLTLLRARAVRVAGMDLSAGMLQVAQQKNLVGRLVQGRAEAVPLASHSVDRLYCINALHHFTDRSAFLAEAKRVLRPGGGLLVVGLDPHDEAQRWWIYDHFDRALDLDRVRYPSVADLRAAMLAAGFEGCSTRPVQRFAETVSLRSALVTGHTDRSSTSQLMVISDLAYEEGMRSLHEKQEALGAADLMLGADLTLYGTTAWVPL
jgi:SAM-dependent methyltransferase